MEFYTVFQHKRPVRLSEQTRAFAMQSLKGKYGNSAMQTPCVCVDDIEDFESLSMVWQYAKAIVKIAADAPLRICENESVSGAATLGAAIEHVVPAYRNGKPLWKSISHLTVDFKTVLFQGVDYLKAQIYSRLNAPHDDIAHEEYHGMLAVIRAMHIWHGRYLEALKDTKPENYETLKNVPFQPAASFREAVQSLWFTFAFLRLCGNWPGIGRIDELLGGFLKTDLANGSITLDEAREFLAGMFIKGCEWIQSDTPASSGDAQHYQNIVLGGIDADGNDVTNEVTYLVLDIVEELPIGDFPISVRFGKQSPEQLVTRAAEVMRHGGGIVAAYNEDLIIDSMVQFGYPLREAREFANDGCWEVQVPGKTRFSYRPFDALAILLNDTLCLNGTPHVFGSYEQLYSAFRDNMQLAVQAITDGLDAHLYGEPVPCCAISLFEQGCIERGRAYNRGGTVYTICSPHIGGAPDVGNCLYIIDKLVFQDKKLPFARFMEILQHNWEGEEALRRHCLNKYTYYGNDCDEPDAYTVRVLDDFADIVAQANRQRDDVLMPAGVSTFGRQIEWADKRSAVPFGKYKNAILSGNASPTPGTDISGATATIKSYCKIDLKKQSCGAALDIKLYPPTVWGENGLTALKSLITGFLALGGFFMQVDVVDGAVLREAQKNPEEYKTLSVRVSGWNARFVTLDREWQQMIIERTEHGLK